MPDNVQLVSIINEAIWVAFITNTEINSQRFFVGFRDVPVGISAGESADNIYSRQAIRTGYIFKPQHSAKCQSDPGPIFYICIPVFPVDRLLFHLPLFRTL